MGSSLFIVVLFFVLVVGDWWLVIGYWLLVLVIGDWLLVISDW